MPPAKKGEPLPKEQQDLIKQWIDEGASFGAWTAKKEGDKPTEKKDGEKPAEAGEKKGGDKKEKGGL
jgi:hypothetical protein